MPVRFENRKEDGFTNLSKEQLIAVLKINYPLILEVDKVYRLENLNLWYEMYIETRDKLIFLPDSFIANLYIYLEVTNQLDLYKLLQMILSINKPVLETTIETKLYNSLNDLLLDEWILKKKVFIINKSNTYEDLINILYEYHTTIYKYDNLQKETICTFIVKDNYYLIEINLEKGLLLHLPNNNDTFKKNLETNDKLNIQIILDGYKEKIYYQQQITILKLQEYIEKKLNIKVVDQSIKIIETT